MRGWKGEYKYTRSVPAVTKRFLDECNVKYEFEDVDILQGDERAAILEDIKKWNPNCSFPTTIIGDKVIVGYKENEFREALGL